jgi:hypothetical protein
MSQRIKWYPYLNKENNENHGNTLLLNEKLDPGSIIVCQELDRRSYTKFPSYSNFGLYLYNTKKSHRCYYEVIMGPQTPYFDFDALTFGHDTAVDPEPIKEDVQCDNISIEPSKEEDRPFFPKLNPPTVIGGPNNVMKVEPPSHSSILGNLIRDQIFKLSGLSEMPQHAESKCIPDIKNLCPYIPPLVKNNTELSQQDIKKQQKLVLTIEEAEEAIIALKKAIIETCSFIKEDDILVYSSHSDKKQSFHVKIDRWCFPDHVENKAFARAVMKNYPEKWHDAIDMSMYKTIQQFRVYESHKWKQDHRVKKFRHDLSSWKLSVIPDDEHHQFGLYLLSSLITNVNSCLPLPSFILPEVKKQYISSGNDDIELSEKDVDDVIKIALKISNVNINNFPYKVNSYKGGIISLRRLRPSLCRVCDRIHEHENPFIFVVGSERNIYFDCRRNAEGKKTHLGSLGYAAPNTIVPGMDICQIMSMFTNEKVDTPQITHSVPQKMDMPSNTCKNKPPLKAVPKIKTATCQEKIDSNLNSKILMMRQLSALRYQ